MMPSKDDFAVEVFGGQALILRLGDMHLFQVNQSALQLFELMLECRGDVEKFKQRLETAGQDIGAEEITAIKDVLRGGESFKVNKNEK